MRFFQSPWMTSREAPSGRAGHRTACRPSVDLSHEKRKRDGNADRLEPEGRAGLVDMSRCRLAERGCSTG